MRQSFSVLAFGLSIGGCTTAQPIRANGPMVTSAQAMPSLCILDGEEAKCDDVLKMMKDNESRIERVEILKGALAASLYGVRSNNGVLVVLSRR